MILIGGDKFPQSMTDVGELLPEALDYTAAIAVVNLWVPDIAAAVAGTSAPFQSEVVYPADASGYVLRVSSSDVLTIAVDSANKVLSFLRPGKATLTWTAENADGSVVSYVQVVTVTSTR